MTAIDNYDASPMLKVLGASPMLAKASAIFKDAALWAAQLSAYAEWAVLHNFAATAPATDVDMFCNHNIAQYVNTYVCLGKADVCILYKADV